MIFNCAILLTFEIQMLPESNDQMSGMYGLIEIHKNNNPARPVISMIGTPEYQVAKFLDSIIKNYIPDSYMLHSTDHFLDKINNFKFKADHKLVSLDV